MSPVDVIVAALLAIVEVIGVGGLLAIFLGAMLLHLNNGIADALDRWWPPRE
jgi:hypothetical protein